MYCAGMTISFRLTTHPSVKNSEEVGSGSVMGFLHGRHHLDLTLLGLGLFSGTSSF